MTKPSRTLPNLLIPGYHKAGTTTLFHELSRHPEISPSNVKEPFYFRPYINGKELPPIAEYERCFTAAKDETYFMEGSPTYVYGEAKAAQKIKEILGDIRIIISLRNPVEQLFSLYKHHLRFMKIDKDETFLSFVQNKADFSRQYYDIHLREWYEVFGDNIKCIFFDSLIQNPELVLAEIINWLGLAPMELAGDKLSNTNPGGTYKNKFLHQLSLKIFKRMKKYISHQTFITIRNAYYAINGKPNTQVITPEARTFLEPVFAEHNRALADLLEGRGYQNLPTWLTSQPDKSDIT